MAKFVIVDDSKIMLKTLKTLLEKMGHEVVGEANDGLHGYIEYENAQPDIITLDVAMPLMNGKETLQKLMKSFPDANIIMISSEQDKSKIIDLIKIGAKHYIIKPVNEDNLSVVVNKILNKK